MDILLVSVMLYKMIIYNKMLYNIKIVLSSTDVVVKLQLKKAVTKLGIVNQIY